MRITRIHLNLSFSRANSRLANIIKALPKECNRNINTLREGNHQFWGEASHNMEVVSFAHRKPSKSGNLV